MSNRKKNNPNKPKKKVITVPDGRFKAFLKQYPAVLLLLFVYLFFIPKLLSYNHAWVEPEEFAYKTEALIKGPALQWNDLKAGLDWQGFEQAPRPTRPLSAYFEILDTKFRSWLWHFMLPHPSLSLTWIFSLIGTPLLLFLLLRYWNLSVNTSAAMVSFYLMTPAVMSYSVMLFHPGKPMSNFFIVACLYMASQLQRNFLDQGKSIPVIVFLFFWIISAFSFYWDEIMWVIVPAIWVLFPGVITKRKSFLCLWLSLPLITVLFYLKIIPLLSLSAGYGCPDLFKYSKALPTLNNPILEFLKYLAGNTKNLILDTMGLMVPDVFNASAWIKLCSGASLAAWGMVCFYLGRSRWRWNSLTFFLGALILFFNFLMTINSDCVWGPYYYGSFWSIFFCLWLGLWIERSNISKVTLTTCFFFILLCLFFCFSAINGVYKKCQYYPYAPLDTSDYFAGQKSFFDPDQTPRFTGDELKKDIQTYWLASKQNSPWAGPEKLPRELYWLIIEMHPGQPHAWYDLKSSDDYISAATLNSNLADSYNNRGEIDDRQGDIPQAVSDFTKAIELDPKLAISYYNRGNDHYHQGDLTDALSDFSKAIENNPDYLEAISIRAFIFASQGKFDQAILDFNKAIELNPNSKPTIDYSKSIERFYDSAELYYNRGLIYAKEGNVLQAISDYNKAIANNPKFASPYNNLAICYYMIKQYDKAWEFVHKAQSLGYVVNPGFISALKEASGRSGA